MEGFFGKFKALTQNSDVIIALGLMMVLGVMVVPIPPLLLDLMLSLSIAVSVAVLLTAFDHDTLSFIFERGFHKKYSPPWCQ